MLPAPTPIYRRLLSTDPYASWADRSCRAPCSCCSAVLFGRVKSGVVVHIIVGAEERGPVVEVSGVRAVAGLGLEGDRYYRRHASGDHDPENEITLVTLEGIEAAARDGGLELTPLDLRRNIVTQGIDLDGLIGSKVRVGEVEIEALGPNPPCRYLQDLVKKPLLKPMMGRGGVRGRIVTSGTINVGDPVIVER